jgi:Domain of unknown function (DUF4203)
VGITLVCGLLAFCLYDHILIQATALFGSFIFVYGIGMVAGRYPNPFTIQRLIEAGQLDNIDPVYYAYLGGNLVLYIIGCVVQYRHKKKNPKKTEYEERMVYTKLRYRR